MRFIGRILLALGCACTQNPMAYSPNATPEQVAADECEREMRRSVPDSAPRGQTAGLPAAPGQLGQDLRVQREREEFFRECMAARGYKGW
jgi:hypothetical protein